MIIKNSQLIEVLPQIAEQYLNTSVSDLRFIGGGSFGKVFKGRLPDASNVILKAYRNQGMQNNEAEQLKLLSQNTSVKMPEVYFTHGDDQIAVMGMSFIEGSNVLNPQYLLKDKTKRQAFAEEVVNGMLEWHSVTGEKYGEISDPTHTSWLEFYREKMIEPKLAGLEKLCKDGKFSKSAFELLNKATELFYQLAQEPEKPVLIHGDLNIMNIMANPKTLKLNGFIDPCGTMWADKEYDLFQLRNMWGDSFYLYETYKEKAEISEHCDFKVAYYGALNEASCRLNGALIFPAWEILCNNRLKKEMKKYL